MDKKTIEALAARAACMLPPATVMMIECAGDTSGDPALAALLEEVQNKGLHREPLCSEPYETIVFSDRVLLHCDGCARLENLPHVAGIGHGKTADEAHRNALYALTLPADRPNTKRPGCFAAWEYGTGPYTETAETCVMNRAAYQNGTPNE